MSPVLGASAILAMAWLFGPMFRPRSRPPFTMRAAASGAFVGPAFAAAVGLLFASLPKLFSASLPALAAVARTIFAS